MNPASQSSGADIKSRLPFELSIRRLDHNQETERVLCRRILRQLADNREVFEASWGERNVIVKVFLKRVIGRYRVRKEWKGLNLLGKRGINAPKPLFYGRTSRGTWAIVTERIAEAQTLDEIYYKAGGKEKVELMKNVCAELAEQHEKGIVQKDLHLGNFLQDREKLVVLDPAEMGFSNWPIGRRKSISQLALLTSNMAAGEGVKEIRVEYFKRRGWRLEELDEQLLEVKAESYKRKGLKKALKKTLRTSKRFVRISSTTLGTGKTGNFVAIFEREYYAQKERSDIGKIIEELTNYNGKELVVERYGHKGFFDSLYQTITGSWAKQKWIEGHQQRLLGKIASKPIAFIERRKRGLVRESYLVIDEKGT